MKQAHKEMRITNETANLSRVRAAMLEFLKGSVLDPELCNLIVVALDEALANVVEHAYQGQEGHIMLDFDLDEQRLQIVIRDNGLRFEHDEKLKSEFDIKRHIKLGRKRGLGLFLIQKIMDTVSFNSGGAGYVNELVLTKQLRCSP